MDGGEKPAGVIAIKLDLEEQSMANTKKNKAVEGPACPEELNMSVQ